MKYGCLEQHIVDYHHDNNIIVTCIVFYSMYLVYILHPTKFGVLDRPNDYKLAVQPKSSKKCSNSHIWYLETKRALDTNPNITSHFSALVYIIHNIL